MKTHEFNGLRTNPISVSGSNGNWRLGSNAVIVSDDLGMVGQEGTHDNRFMVAGDIVASEAGVLSYGKNDEIVVGRDATIIVNGESSKAVWVVGVGATISNAGNVFASDYALLLEADHSRATNSGLITGRYGMTAAGDDIRLVNGSNGKIEAAAVGLYAVTFADEHVTLINHGAIVVAPDGLAVAGQFGNETLINDGSMVGNIDLGSGNDWFDTRGGTIRGELLLGFDDDTLITDKSNIVLTEFANGGFDTVKSTVSYTLNDHVEALFLIGSGNIDGDGNNDANQIHGNNGRNVLNGHEGNDFLVGGKGNDRLIGGADGDIFHFGTGGGQDVITDFEDGLDMIDLGAWADVISFPDLMKHHLQVEDGRLVITAGDDSLTILGVQKDDLNSGDFLFIPR